MDKITTAMIDDALLKRYQEPEWYLGFEVGNSCGADCRRHADAIAICAYPSRGFESRGFEVKISRSDLQHELNNPAKCEEMYQYVNEWYLVVPKGLIKDMAIPEPWGIIEYEDGKLRQKRNAKYHEAKLTIGFLVAFVRGRKRATQYSQAKLEEKIRKDVEYSMQWRLGNDSKELKGLKEMLATIEKETGLPLDQYRTKDNIRTIKIAQNICKELRIGYGYGVGRKLKDGMEIITESVQAIQKAYEPLLALIGENEKEASR